MSAAKTAKEREQIRNEHHERMKERTVERGLTLPEGPPARGCGMGPGGEGIGPGGSGMGSPKVVARVPVGIVDTDIA
jgi:hypothetical protein